MINQIKSHFGKWGGVRRNESKSKQVKKGHRVVHVSGQSFKCFIQGFLGLDWSW